MVFWSGFGFLVGIIGLGSLVGSEIITESITGNESFYQDNPSVRFIAMLVAATLTEGLNKTLFLSKSKIVIDKETGEEMIWRKKHSFFYIPTKWWPALFICIGMVAYIAAYSKV